MRFRWPIQIINVKCHPRSTTAVDDDEEFVYEVEYKPPLKISRTGNTQFCRLPKFFYQGPLIDPIDFCWKTEKGGCLCLVVVFSLGSSPTIETENRAKRLQQNVCSICISFFLTDQIKCLICFNMLLFYRCPHPDTGSLLSRVAYSLNMDSFCGL